MLGKVLIVDDHPLFIEGLRYMLETYGVTVVGMAQNGLEAIEKAKSLKPEIVLMDIDMPICDGLEALKKIKKESPQIKVVMLTVSQDDDSLFEAIRFGASGYLLKSLNAKELIDMLKQLQKGEILISSGLAVRFLDELRDNKHLKEESIRKSDSNSKNKKKTVLTKRQIEVLELVAKGNTYKEIGDILGLKERTIKYHMGRIIEILQIENRAQAILRASKMGLVDNERS